MKSLNALLASSGRNVPKRAMGWHSNFLTSAKKRSAVGTRLRGPNPNPKTASLHYALRIIDLPSVGRLMRR